MRRRVRTDYKAKAERELNRALAYPEGQPNQVEYTNRYRTALHRALRHARTAFMYGQMTEADLKHFNKRVGTVWR